MRSPRRRGRSRQASAPAGSLAARWCEGAAAASGGSQDSPAAGPASASPLPPLPTLPPPPPTLLPPPPLPPLLSAGGELRNASAPPASLAGLSAPASAPGGSP